MVELVSICILAIENVTYVTQRFDIKSNIVVNIVVKSIKTQTKWYFMFSDHGCLLFPMNI